MSRLINTHITWIIAPPLMSLLFVNFATVAQWNGKYFLVECDEFAARLLDPDEDDFFTALTAMARIQSRSRQSITLSGCFTDALRRNNKYDILPIEHLINQQGRNFHVVVEGPWHIPYTPTVKIHLLTRPNLMKITRWRQPSPALNLPPQLPLGPHSRLRSSLPLVVEDTQMIDLIRNALLPSASMLVTPVFDNLEPVSPDLVVPRTRTPTSSTQRFNFAVHPPSPATPIVQHMLGRHRPEGVTYRIDVGRTPTLANAASPHTRGQGHRLIEELASHVTGFDPHFTGPSIDVRSTSIIADMINQFDHLVNQPTKYRWFGRWRNDGVEEAVGYGVGRDMMIMFWQALKSEGWLEGEDSCMILSTKARSNPSIYVGIAHGLVFSIINGVLPVQLHPVILLMLSSWWKLQYVVFNPTIELLPQDLEVCRPMLQCLPQDFATFQQLPDSSKDPLDDLESTVKNWREVEEDRYPNWRKRCLFYYLMGQPEVYQQMHQQIEQLMKGSMISSNTLLQLQQEQLQPTFEKILNVLASCRNGKMIDRNFDCI